MCLQTVFGPGLARLLASLVLVFPVAKCNAGGMMVSLMPKITLLVLALEVTIFLLMSIKPGSVLNSGFIAPLRSYKTPVLNKGFVTLQGAVDSD